MLTNKYHVKKRLFYKSRVLHLYSVEASRSVSSSNNFFPPFFFFFLKGCYGIGRTILRHLHRPSSQVVWENSSLVLLSHQLLIQRKHLVQTIRDTGKGL